MVPSARRNVRGPKGTHFILKKFEDICGNDASPSLQPFIMEQTISVGNI